LSPLNITAMLDIPVHLHGRLKGVLCHEQVGPPVPWTAEDRLFGIAVANMISLALEQSERKRAEAALRESEQRLATMLAYAPTPSCCSISNTLHSSRRTSARCSSMAWIAQRCCGRPGRVEPGAISPTVAVERSRARESSKRRSPAARRCSNGRT
jgi:GAF domain-containing protein